MKYLILFGLLLGNIFGATTYFATQSGAGSKNGTSLGNAWDMTSGSTGVNNSGNWSNTIGTSGKISPDDTLSLNGTLTNGLTVQNSGTSGHQITILFATNAKFSTGVWGTSTGAAIYASGKSYITIDGGSNGVIENTDNGTVLGNQSTTAAIWGESSGVHWILHDLTIQNMYQRTPSSSSDTNTGGSSGFRGINFTDMDDFQFTNVFISWCKLGYNFSFSAAPGVGATFTNCTTDRCSTGYNGGLGAVGTPVINNMTFTNCVCSNAYVWDYPPGELFHSDGIHLFTTGSTGYWANVTITRFSALTGWGIHTTSPVFLEGDYQNIIVANCLVGSTDYKAEGYIDIQGLHSGGTTGLVYGNTVVGLSSTNTGGLLCYLQGNLWSSLTAKNNILYNGYAGVTVSETQSVSNLHFDNNDYNSVGNFAIKLDSGSNQTGSYGSLSAWATYLGSKGDEASGKTASPVFVGSGNYALQSSSTLIDAGASLGSPYNVDILGTSRPQASGYDIGAYEFGSLSPVAPSSYQRGRSAAGSGF